MRKTRFKARVRIDNKQLAWLKENKNTKTIAGFLDLIINNFKKYGVHEGNFNRGSVRKKESRKDIEIKKTGSIQI